ncbi:hypothetical protein DPMN_133195 [Dreissena polymorpha]|uniref:FAD dependent oxidoreductase domain-containing protein n=1 Tax=Dreissena polymorpha TaxID=45954 RepID=A0A9D4JDS3_DREPO|nr:hypothetical protein DPMN_133195 [Dreissena polymorpha]
MYDIVVLGAGAVGLSTAFCIHDALPGRQVTIIADKLTTETTSHGAAGIFRPTTVKTPVESIEQFRKWCTDSFAWFHRLNTESDPAQTGVSRVTGYQFLKQPSEKVGLDIYNTEYRKSSLFTVVDKTVFIARRDAGE